MVAGSGFFGLALEINAREPPISGFPKRELEA
jgi:hypothetical protein